ncbi:uncharacterized protein K452DRAFT_19398 [Aplosporella prunicola CBS 121167]|uniref:Uncharacterized protein n=1 Tax=Aplosporella prunicola CBS 121167 TaxID=1176127 RepID=A0A6A6BE71_9PEZI|nr:uncharacterized protein K452DRAFT_19398 [Aplosporella prunicola CBS 121167]KAF2142469.1 hypothetical protein K452DRAFT_19398 [Aplosporella prunicola CBS 121167]
MLVRSHEPPAHARGHGTYLPSSSTRSRALVLSLNPQPASQPSLSRTRALALALSRQEPAPAPTPTPTPKPTPTPALLIFAPRQDDTQASRSCGARVAENSRRADRQADRQTGRRACAPTRSNDPRATLVAEEWLTGWREERENAPGGCAQAGERAAASSDLQAGRQGGQGRPVCWRMRVRVVLAMALAGRAR